MARAVALAVYGYSICLSVIFTLNVGYVLAICENEDDYRNVCVPHGTSGLPWPLSFKNTCLLVAAIIIVVLFCKCCVCGQQKQEGIVVAQANQGGNPANGTPLQDINVIPTPSAHTDRLSQENLTTADDNLLPSYRDDNDGLPKYEELFGGNNHN